MRMVLHATIRIWVGYSRPALLLWVSVQPCGVPPTMPVFFQSHYSPNISYPSNIPYSHSLADYSPSLPSLLFHHMRSRCCDISTMSGSVTCHNAWNMRGPTVSPNVRRENRMSFTASPARFSRPPTKTSRPEAPCKPISADRPLLHLCSPRPSASTVRTLNMSTQPDYVTLPAGTSLLDYLSRPFVCPAPKCPHRYLSRSQLAKHEQDAHPALSAQDTHSDYYSDESPGPRP